MILVGLFQFRTSHKITHTSKSITLSARREKKPSARSSDALGAIFLGCIHPSEESPSPSTRGLVLLPRGKQKFATEIPAAPGGHSLCVSHIQLVDVPILSPRQEISTREERAAVEGVGADKEEHLRREDKGQSLTNGDKAAKGCTGTGTELFRRSARLFLSHGTNWHVEQQDQVSRDHSFPHRAVPQAHGGRSAGSAPPNFHSPQTPRGMKSATRVSVLLSALVSAPAACQLPCPC